ncbi:MAG: hypothetical protein EB060_01535 [Proteobacteria bacterium]|nr:hypothetical protein [Pseudomonadota bacterium]
MSITRTKHNNDFHRYTLDTLPVPIANALLQRVNDSDLPPAAWDIYYTMVFGTRPDPFAEFRETHPECRLSKKEMVGYAVLAARELYIAHETVAQVSGAGGNMKNPTTLALENLMYRIGDKEAPPSTETFKLFKTLLKETARPVVEHAYNTTIANTGRHAFADNHTRREVIDLLLDRDVPSYGRDADTHTLTDGRAGVVPSLLMAAFNQGYNYDTATLQLIINTTSSPVRTEANLLAVQDTRLRTNQAWVNRIADESLGPDVVSQFTDREHFLETYARAREVLTQRQREVLDHLYGINDGIEKTQEETATHFGLTGRASVSGILKNAEKRIRESGLSLFNTPESPSRSNR